MNPVALNITIFFQFISFLIVLWLIVRFLAKPINKVMRERQARIRDALAQADRARAEAAARQQQQIEELNQARAQAQSLLANAREAADKLRDEELARARDEATRLVEQARTAIGQERERTKQELRAYMVDLTIEATRRVIGSTLDLSGQHRLIERTVDDVLTTGNGATGGASNARA